MISGWSQSTRSAGNGCARRSYRRPDRKSRHRQLSAQSAPPSSSPVKSLGLGIGVFFLDHVARPLRPPLRRDLNDRPLPGPARASLNDDRGREADNPPLIVGTKICESARGFNMWYIRSRATTKVLAASSSKPLRQLTVATKL